MSRGTSEESIFSSKNQHFFKIILEDTLTEQRLLIPKKFVRIYGETLSDSVHIKLPCGSHWEMELTKREGSLWLTKGWSEFAKHYSIARGHMLVFRYQGSSKFRVVIFDTTAVEIDYHPKINLNDRDIVEIDDSVEILDDINPRKRMRTSPELRIKEQCELSPSQKNPIDIDEKMGDAEEINGFICADKATKTPEPEIKREEPESDSDINFEIETSEASLKSQVTETLERSGVNSDIGTCERSLKSTAYTRGEKTRILERAHFVSKNPFFKVIIQPSYIDNKSHLNVPLGFVKRYFKNEGEIILRDPNKRCWSVLLKIWQRNSEFYGGWFPFVKHHNLEVGDVCIFELINETKVSFNVSIVRFGNSRGNNNFGSRIRALERAYFVSEKPFFKVFMRPTYVDGYSIYIPSSFAQDYIKNRNVNVVLCVRNSTTKWVTKLITRRLINRRDRTVLSRGWKEFANSNNLKPGDVCIFELLNETKLLFQVSIISHDVVEE